METTAFAFADGSFKECQLVDEFLRRRIRPLVDSAASESDEKHSAFKGLLLRTAAWFRTLAKLNESADFQAALSASRALFEIAVDVALMHFDPSNYAAAKMWAFGDSVKLKEATKTRRYYEITKAASPPDVAPKLSFIAANEARVRALRAQWWGGKHPPRWTGHTLEDDAAGASRFFPQGGFVEWYALSYGPACWNVHGSALVGVAGIAEENFPALGGFAFSDCAKFGIITAEIIVREFGRWIPEMENEFQDRLLERLLVKHQAMTKNNVG